jgi:uncharacterized membrane protein YeaQ/YmgE (transglycosylase-associated protein family)
MFISGFNIAAIVSWLLLGLVVGLIVHLIDPGETRGGIIGTVVTGLVGAVVGGFLANLFLGLAVTGFNLQSIIIAVIGALILTVIERILFRDREHIKTKITKLKE